MSDYANHPGGGLTAFGMAGGPIDLSSQDYAVTGPVKAVVTTSAGNIVMRARRGTADITFTGVPVGFLPPFVPGIIRKNGTTATLATVED